jgi:hypothetical protein
VEHHSGAPLGLAVTLLEDFRLGWRGLPVTNCLEYYDMMNKKYASSYRIVYSQISKDDSVDVCG